MQKNLSAVVATIAVMLTACGGSGSTAPGGGGQLASLSISIGTDPIASGTSIQASATITDASGKTSPALNVTWSSSDPTIAHIDASGLITGRLAGSATIIATSSGVTGQKSVTVKPGTPASVTIYAGDNQRGNRGSALTDPLCVLVKDAAGNVITGVVATYAVETGGGALGAPTAPSTDSRGVAISGFWTLGSVVGEQTVVATVAGAGSVTFKATAQ
ncbi:MAG TPA: Ig-like domain-containing protein [Gemmatimonadaceae bacterium]|nr:Ig-like domain-containing protein [Gemmatimonadaceae bacterium]